MPNIDLVRKLSSLKSIERLEIQSNGLIVEGRDDEILDLTTLTSLKSLRLAGLKLKVKLPSSLTGTVNINHCLPPILAPGTNKITSLNIDSVYCVCNSKELWNEFFIGLSNCTNLSTLSFNGECGLSCIDDTPTTVKASISSIFINKAWSSTYWFNR